jgi:hypothetical protein
MELDLQSLFGRHVYICTIGRDQQTIPPPSPAFRIIYEGAIGRPRETTSLCDPLNLPRVGVF